MTNEEVETLSRCAGFMKYLTPPGTREWHANTEDIASLIRTVMLEERIACAKICNDASTDGYGYLPAVADAIRMRSNVKDQGPPNGGPAGS